jgi:hypothetical protein
MVSGFMVTFSRFAAATAMVSFASAPALARDCRPVEAPPGVRVPEQVGCKPARAAAKTQAEPSGVRSGRHPGWIDLGNGTEVRISGGVGFEGRSRGR